MLSRKSCYFQIIKSPHSLVEVTCMGLCVILCRLKISDCVSLYPFNVQTISSKYTLYFLRCHFVKLFHYDIELKGLEADNYLGSDEHILCRKRGEPTDVAQTVACYPVTTLLSLTQHYISLYPLLPAPGVLPCYLQHTMSPRL